MYICDILSRKTEFWYSPNDLTASSVVPCVWCVRLLRCVASSFNVDVCTCDRRVHVCEPRAYDQYVRVCDILAISRKTHFWLTFHWLNEFVLTKRSFSGTSRSVVPCVCLSDVRLLRCHSVASRFNEDVHICIRMYIELPYFNDRNVAYRRH